mmetsp:Transcript_131805/g.367416  ORF Transcript_131805/g.367416 Transcript_131805/m.367416 type:complete len:196 (-) Transcript_131805:110-697(-)
MLGGSLFAVFFESLMALGDAWARGGFPAMPTHGNTMAKLVLVAVTNTVGQVLIYYTIKEFGSVVFAWIMTTRKVISVVFSFLWFGHPISWLKVLCICVVFGIIILNQVFKPHKKPAAHGAHKAVSSPSASPKSVSSLAKGRRFSKNISWSEISTSATSGEEGSEESPAEEASSPRNKAGNRLSFIAEGSEGKKCD